MRKGALKKKQRQLEELLLDRREALGELVLGMYVQNNWDDDLLARGSAEVAEVETELNELIAGNEPVGPSATEKDFPITGEHRLPTGEHDYPATGEYTAEHPLPDTGEHTSEHSLPVSGEHDYPATGEYTAEHSLPESAELTAEHTAEQQLPPEPPKLSRAEKKQAKKEKKEREKAEASKPEEPAAAEPAPAPAPAEPKPAEPKAAPMPSIPKPAVAKAPEPEPVQPKPAEKPPEDKPSAEQKQPLEVPAPPAPPKPEPTDPLDVLDKQIAETEAKSKTALEAARASLKTSSPTELTAITHDIETGRGELEESLKKAAAAIASAEEKATQAEARLLRETAAGREAAAEWVRGQASEIEADAALAAEMSGDPQGAAPAGDPDPVLAARVTSLEAELAAEKAAKDEALTKAAARLQEIEQSAKLAEARVEAAEAAATEAKNQAQVQAAAAPAADGNQTADAEAREAAVNWLRGQIGALRQEIAKSGESGKDAS